MVTVKNLPDGRVHIEFEKTDGTNKLVDAIVVSPAQYAAWTEADIDAIIEKRWENYLIAITPVEPEEEVEEEEVEGEDNA
jgi:acylphosphatase